MTNAESKVRECVAQELSKLKPAEGGAYGPEQLAQALRRVTTQCGPDLAEVARLATAQDGECSAAPHFCRYALLAYQDARVSAWLLGWPEGNPGTEIHDHGDSHAAVAVISGTVRETLYAEHGTQTVRDLPAGSIVRIPKEYIHKFEDERVGSEGLSLHLYSPPLARMGYWGYRPDGTFGRAGEWDAAAESKAA